MSKKWRRADKPLWALSMSTAKKGVQLRQRKWLMRLRTGEETPSSRIKSSIISDNTVVWNRRKSKKRNSSARATA